MKRTASNVLASYSAALFMASAAVYGNVPQKVLDPENNLLKSNAAYRCDNGTWPTAPDGYQPNNVIACYLLTKWQLRDQLNELNGFLALILAMGATMTSVGAVGLRLHEARSHNNTGPNAGL